MTQLKRQLLSLLLSIVFGVLALQPVSGIQAQSTPEDEPPFISGGLAWSPDGDVIAVGTSNGFSLHSGTDLRLVDQWTSDVAITSLDWNPNGQSIIVSGDDGTVQIVNIPLDATTLQFQGHSRNAVNVAWSPDGELIASVGWDLILRIWDSSTGEINQSVELGYPIEYSLSWNPNSEQIAIFILDQDGGRNCIWHIETEAWSLCWSHNRETSSVKWSPDGTTIATCGGDQEIRVWDAATGELLYILETPYVADSLSWNPDNSKLASNSSNGYEGITQIWDTTTHELVTEFQGVLLNGDAFYSNTLAWSPDGSRLASVSDDGKIYLWDMLTYEQIAVYEGYRSILRSN